MLPLVPTPVYRSKNTARQRKAGLRPPWTPRGRWECVQLKIPWRETKLIRYTENDVKRGAGPMGSRARPPPKRKSEMTNIYKIYRIYMCVIDVAHNAPEKYYLCPVSHARLFKNVETTMVPLSHRTRNQSARSMLAYVSNSA